MFQSSLADTPQIGFSPDGLAAVRRSQITYLYLLVGLLATVSAIPITALATILFAMVLVDFMLAIDESPPVRELAGLISTLQYVFGPMLLYTFFNDHYRYRMYVPPDTYFAFAVPATCLFLVALRVRLPFGTTTMQLPVANKESLGLGLILVGVGIASGVLVRFGPGSLAFAFYLLANLRYVGAIYVYMSENQFRWPIIALVVSGIFLTSAKQGMFHELLLWGSLGGCYWFTGKQRSLSAKVTFIAAGIAAVMVIQIVKPIYRQQMGVRDDVSFVGTARDVVVSDLFLSEKSLENVVTRISQGWIISAAMKTVPKHREFANGKTIEDALVAAFVPRILVADKKGANVRANLNRYTFLKVGKRTQMGLGPLGECWVNFGYFGGILGLAVFGLLLNSVFHIIGKLSWRNEYFFYCLPIIFLQVIKAETEFQTIFNHLTKSSLVVFASYQGFRIAGLIAARRVSERATGGSF
ncbi:hypothetical protein [Rhodopirellula baltica]|uniref:Uncharacterized protein n=1 Tax=Rhodopirellula baltica SWK14 TaxID=993516 RepID=L7CMX1_RHOBT|nr:hypothetical protein [Rhodopirellula baltica]ELP34406.1 hypothetical protein RBSWK_01682 [Rhodopirellula baltica SWK14]